ncbi:MAG: SPW repeat protein [Patescibacteria group bacterium]
MTWQGWVNFIAGLWIILSAFLNFSVDTMFSNLVVTGLVVAALSLWEELQYERDDRVHAHM